MTINLVSVTPDAEKTMAHIARVSNPENQDIPNMQDYLDIVLSIIIGLFLSSHQ